MDCYGHLCGTGSYLSLSLSQYHLFFISNRTSVLTQTHARPEKDYIFLDSLAAQYSSVTKFWLTGSKRQ